MRGGGGRGSRHGMEVGRVDGEKRGLVQVLKKENAMQGFLFFFDVYRLHGNSFNY